jgi:L-lysine 2,3-aminomutase
MEGRAVERSKNPDSVGEVARGAQKLTGGEVSGIASPPAVVDRPKSTSSKAVRRNQQRNKTRHRFTVSEVQAEG